MIIVGELINASRKTIATAIESHDVEAIKSIAADELAEGAAYIEHELPEITPRRGIRTGLNFNYSRTPASFIDN